MRHWRSDMAGEPAQPHRARVLIVAGHPDSLLNFRGDLIRTLLARQHAVHAAAPDLGAASECARRLNSWGVATHPIQLQRTGLNPVRDLQTAHELYRLIRRIEPTHLLGYTVKPVIYGMLAARWARLPRSTALITGLGYAFAGERLGLKRRMVQRLLRVMYRSALRGARRVIFQNPDDRELFVQLGLVRAEQCAVVDGSGVNLDAYRVAPLPPVAGPIRFLLIARLIRDKGIAEFVAAGRQLRQLHPQIELHLVGGLDQNPEAISRAELERWQADGSIVYHGHLADVRPAIARCHVFVLPSYYREGIPRTILETMAMGRPVITCDAPGCRETVVDGKNGYLVPTRDVPALTSAMLRFVAEPSNIGRMGQAARQVAEQRYDVAKVNYQMLVHMGLEDAVWQSPQAPEPITLLSDL